MTRRLLRRLATPALAAGLALTACTAGAHHTAAPHASAPTGSGAGNGGAKPRSDSPVPLLAFFYQWFDAAQWNRAKIDYPQIGRYDSSDTAVMRQQILQAQSVGIDGFIVSWKDTPLDDQRLKLLMGVAAQLHFKLAMIYQGLDFSRKPLPPDRVARDFVTFADDYATDPVFLRLGGKPLTVWSGTWSFSHDQVAQVTAPVRAKLQVLNTEKSVAGYQRIADATDGDAYYWSSVDPTTNDNYGAKLRALSTAIHRDGKYWIAPFSPGFDARLVGGTKTVDRQDGRTLQAEYAAAVNSSPDALGLISWNEFSENSYVEPSVKYGTRYLDVLKELRTTSSPALSVLARDSNESLPGDGTHASVWPNAIRLGGFVAVLLTAAALPALRSRRRRHRETVGSGTAAAPREPKPTSRR